MKKRKQSDLAVLLDYAGSYRRLTFLGLALAPDAMTDGRFSAFVTNSAFYAVFSAIIATALARITFAASGMMLAGTAWGGSIRRCARLSYVTFRYDCAAGKPRRPACPEANREQVMEALEAAQRRDIIERLPQGADTQIGSEGTYLSGGEAQRIALARGSS